MEAPSPTTTPGDAAVSKQDLANAIRALAMDAVQKAKSGHPGMPMGMADVATVLFTQFFRFDASRPDWPDRDRFVLSAGHGSMLLYALLYLTGYEDMSLEEIKNFRQLGSRTAGHPEYGDCAGIETTTGPLGQGFGMSVGMALAERLLSARYGEKLVNHYTYVIASDGDLMEGVSHEAAALAGHLGLSKLIVLYDDNEISIDGSTNLADSTDQLKRFEAYGWDTRHVDGHDPQAVAEAIAAARDSDRPSLIACKTTIGFGAPTLAGSAKTHGAPLGEEEIAGAREKLGWPYEPFEIPDAILAAWRAVGARGQELSADWDTVVAEMDSETRDHFLTELSGDLPQHWSDAVEQFKRQMSEEQPKLATRQASQKVLDLLTAAVPNLIGGSADLTGSNGTKAAGQKVIDRNDFSGSYIH
ncbi:MAG: 1-deoxy-D-xylulose-5-phosphate synthase N-terminal domain-containing protein, partial [Rhodovibrionaceae bacterium]|nr:1-deoxy-D-xylulose-5-phosphate synthase N-terminal domain-containing protein [Rhodovibrionaceae bacterium]